MRNKTLNTFKYYPSFGSSLIVIKTQPQCPALLPPATHHLPPGLWAEHKEEGNTHYPLLNISF